MKWVLKVSHYKSMGMIPKQPKNCSNNQSWLSINTKVATGLQDKNLNLKPYFSIHYIQHKLAANGVDAQKFRWPSSSLLEQAHGG